MSLNAWPVLAFYSGIISYENVKCLQGKSCRHPLSTCSTTPCVRTIGIPTTLLPCNFNRNTVSVLPDTGSEVDLVSKDIAEKHFKFEISPRFKWIEYADGSIGKVCGMIRGELVIGSAPPVYSELDQQVVIFRFLVAWIGNWRFAIGDGAQVIYSVDVLILEDGPTNPLEAPVYRLGGSTTDRDTRRVIEVELYVTKHLAADILLGEKSLNGLKAYDLPDTDVYSASQHVASLCSVNRIIDISDSAVHTFMRKVQRVFGVGIGSTTDIEGIVYHSSGVIMSLMRATAQTTTPVTHQPHQPHSDDDEHQRENARQESETARIALLSGQARVDAEDVERGKRDLYFHWRRRSSMRS